jgi:membrane-bound ClpP family serine protease
MEYAITALIVLFATILLVVEILLIPGFGFTGILGTMAMIASVFYAFFRIGNLAGWITFAVVALISIALFVWALYGKSLDRVALKKNIDSTVRETAMDSIAVGDRGIARTRLALIGEAEFNGNIVEVKSEDGFIDEGVEVEVSRVSGDSLFVKVVK